jgi:hypothetical protein
LNIESCAERYDNNSWASLATDGSDLYLNGQFPAAGANFARLNLEGNTWHDLSRPGPGWLNYDRPIFHNQDLYVIESTFLAPTQSFPDYWKIIQGDGLNWTELVTSENSIRHLVIQKDLLYYQNDWSIQRLELINSTAGAERIADPFSFNTMAADSTNLYVGGNFNNINGEPFFHIARWGDEIDCSTTSEKNALSIQRLELIVSPNPASDIIDFSFSDDHRQNREVTVIDIIGKNVFKKTTRDKQIDISHLSPGVYFLQVQCGEVSAVAKFVKE